MKAERQRDGSNQYTDTRHVGVVGLAVMGENLALNIERNGFAPAVFNRTAARTEEFLATRGKDTDVLGTFTIQEFVASLERPRRILLMVKAGAPVDAVIEELAPFLEEGDILIDGGNSLFTDTERRSADLAGRGFQFVGMGVSGGEEGALWGPSLMPGGPRRSLRCARPDAGGDCREVRVRRLRDAHRTRRRWPLRQDGPQRDRVRRHAIDRRSDGHHAPRARA